MRDLLSSIGFITLIIATYFIIQPVMGWPEPEYQIQFIKREGDL